MQNPGREIGVFCFWRVSAAKIAKLKIANSWLTRLPYFLAGSTSGGADVGIHQIFSQNLRNKCVRFGSIAEACIQIAVNRQQFNKYLSGAMLPNARTLSRICLVLEIQEWELFVPANDDSTNSVASHSENVSENAAMLSNFVLSAPAETILNSNMEPNFGIGFYNCYFPVPNFRGFAVRSRVRISKSTSLYSFVRHTRITSPSEPNSKLAHGKHRGIIVSNGATDYFIGVNSQAPMNISFMAFPRESTELKVGLAIIHGVNQQFACRVVFEYQGQAFRQTKGLPNQHSIISTDGTALNPVVAKILNWPLQDIAGQLTLLNVENLLFNDIGLPR